MICCRLKKATKFVDEKSFQVLDLLEAIGFYLIEGKAADSGLLRQLTLSTKLTERSDQSPKPQNLKARINSPSTAHC
jgi:hypothetical protein